jgi:hypothetical protein
MTKVHSIRPTNAASVYLSNDLTKSNMGLFDFLKNNKADDSVNKNEKKPYSGDLNKTKVLRELFKIHRALRDDQWKHTLYSNVADASFQSGNPQVIEGPDGFPYFQLNTPEPYQEFQCYVIRHMKDDFLLHKGFGVVINATKEEPDWVFSYGDILNFHIRREFYTPSKNWQLPNQEVINEKEEVLVGQPSESVLPEQARTVIREFLKGLGINDCKLLLMNRRKSGDYLQELVFNLTPDKFQNKEHYEAVMKNIWWYLPRHYSYVSMHDHSLGDSFKPL